MKDFVFKMPTKVYFGNGAVKNLGNICREYGASKCFVISGPNVAATPAMDAVKAALDQPGLSYEIYTKVKPDPTIEMVDAAADVMKSGKADIVIALGGGSPIDLAKAAAMLMTNEGSVREYLFGGSRTVTNLPLPLIAIPTTAGTGSEVTAASVIADTENNIKLSVTHEYLIPKAAVIDPSLHTGMPTMITASTGFDALTHAIESYVSLNAGPISDAMGIYAIRLIADNLRTAVADGNNIEARANMAVASLLGGVAFLNGGLGVIHGIAQSMGGLHNTPHGIANGVLLPYGMERNCVGNLKKFRDIAVVLGEDVECMTLREAAFASVDAVLALQEDTNMPNSLKELNIGKKDFPDIIERTMKFRLMPMNPCKLTEDDVEGILNRAYEGRKKDR